MTEQEILTDFPQLTGDDIRACLAFAADPETSLLAIASSQFAPRIAAMSCAKIISSMPTRDGSAGDAR